MKINLLTFTPTTESINLAVYTEKVENSNPLTQLAANRTKKIVVQ